MIKYKIRQLSSLEKVFLNNKDNFTEHFKGSMLKNEEYSYQIAFTKIVEDEWSLKTEAHIKIESELAEFITVRLVKNVPSEIPAYKFDCDDGYITTDAGLFPDVLLPLDDNTVEIIPNVWQSLWVSISIPGDFEKPGEYDIKISVGDEQSIFKLEIIDANLPKQELIFTQWFHSDCIADVHNAEINSDKHWNLIRKYIKTAVYNGINMLLTPVFTVPLDTKIGGERPTFQLVSVKYDGEYTFNFDMLTKWVDICLENGIEYFEISHLFTQWGAKHTQNCGRRIWQAD